MPIYEGSSKEWEHYKAHLEKEAEMEAALVNVVNPIEQLNELFPEAEFSFPDGGSRSCGFDGFFRAQFTIAGGTHVGVGTSKKDAKANAAANAVEALEQSGQMAQRRAEMEAKRKERQEKQKPTDKADAETQEKSSASSSDKDQSRNPSVKLQELYPQVTYRVVGETPLRNTAIHAFVAAATLGTENFIGVGRSKKLAKTAAAEKALHALGFWTKDDEDAKRNRLKAAKGEVIPPLMGVAGFGPIPSSDRVQPLMGSYSKPGRGRGGWGRGSRDHHRAGRGRGYAAGFDDWHGGADTFGGDSEGLDMMVGELSGLVGQILETNPNMGVTAVWNLLQQNPEYQSWRSGAQVVWNNTQSSYQSYGPGGAGASYYGADPSYDYGYSGEGYFYSPEAGRGRGVSVRSWSRDSAGRGGGGGGSRGGKKKTFQKASYW